MEDGWHGFAGAVLGFLIAVVLWVTCDVGTSKQREEDSLRRAGAVQRCWQTVTKDKDCRMVCPGFDPFAVQEIKK